MKTYYKVEGKEYYLDVDRIISLIEHNEGEINVGKFDIIRLWLDQFISLNDNEVNEATGQSPELTNSGKILWNTLLKYDVLVEIKENKTFFKPKEV